MANHKEMSESDLKRFREAFVQDNWQNYQRTKDRRYLANICEEMPFFGNSEVGQEIAKLLTLDYALKPLKKDTRIKEVEDLKIWALWLSYKSHQIDGKPTDEYIYRLIAQKLNLKTNAEEENYGLIDKVEKRVRKLKKEKNFPTPSLGD